MRQIIHTVRCLTVALVLVAAFVTLVGAPQASAAEKTPDMEAVEGVCLAEGGLYYEDYENGVVVGYGCLFPEGTTWHCNATGTLCLTIYPSYPTEETSAPPSTNGENADPYPPVQSAPADAYDSGYQYQLAGQ